MRAAVVTLVLGLLIAACGGGGGGTAPLGLGTVELPDDRESVRAALTALPAEVAGLPRQEQTGRELVVSYEEGGSTYVRAQPIEQVTPGRDPAEALAQIVEGGTVGVEGAETSEDADVVYVLASSVAEGRNSYLATWARPDGDWIFAVQAFSPEARDALVRAFVVAAGSESE